MCLLKKLRVEISWTVMDTWTLNTHAHLKVNHQVGTYMPTNNGFFIKFVPNCRVPTEKIMTSNIVDSHGHVDTQHTRTFKGKSSGRNIHAQT